MMSSFYISLSLSRKRLWYRNSKNIYLLLPLVPFWPMVQSNHKGWEQNDTERHINISHNQNCSLIHVAIFCGRPFLQLNQIGHLSPQWDLMWMSSMAFYMVVLLTDGTTIPFHAMMFQPPPFPVSTAIPLMPLVLWAWFFIIWVPPCTISALLRYLP